MTTLTQKIFDSYRNIFRFHVPELLAEKADRFHLYDFFIKLIIGFIFLIITPLITFLPIYPILYLFITYQFNIQTPFSGKIGEMNSSWVLYIYAYLILGGLGLQSGLDITFFTMFTMIFFLLTPIMITLLWWYAEPVSIHDLLASFINEQRDLLPFSNGGIAYSTMRCPGDVLSQLQTLTSQQGSGYIDSLKNVFGLSTTGIIVIILTGLLFIATIILIICMYIYPEENRSNNIPNQYEYESSNTNSNKNKKTKTETETQRHIILQNS
jgi:hypothetical protein